MPGVLIIEAMAQCGGILMLNALDKGANNIAYFSSIDHAKFRRPVLPGDQLIFEIEQIHKRRTLIHFRGKAFVDGQLVAEAEMMAALASSPAPPTS